MQRQMQTDQMNFLKSSLSKNVSALTLRAEGVVAAL